MNQKIACVTGASGKIGQRIVRDLLKKNIHVRVLCYSKPNLTPGIECFSGGLSDANVLQEFLSGARYLFHCAAELHNNERMQAVNVEGTEQLFKIASKSKLQYFCHMSSAGVIGITKRKWVKEDEACNPTNEYERTKYEAEKIVNTKIRHCSTVILRPVNVMDDDNAGVFSLPISHSFIDKLHVFIKGNECAHQVHAEYVAKSALFFMDKKIDRPEIFFVGNDEEDANTYKGIWNMVSEDSRSAYQPISVSLDMRKGGGYAERTFQMTRFLNKRNISCSVLTFSLDLTKQRIKALAPAKVVALTLISQRFNIPVSGWMKTFRLVRDADIVHLMGHWYFINVMSYIAIRYYKKPYVVCPAGALPLFGRSKVIKRIFNTVIGNSIINNADGWIAVVEDERAHFESYGISPSLVSVIPNGVCEEDFPEGDEVAFRKKYGLSDAPIILFMGRLNLIKGPDLLLEAFIESQPKLQDFQLVFAGPDEGLLAPLTSLTEKHNLSDKVHFIGYLDSEDKATAYRSAELLVIPSRSEAMSIVALEAGICSTPVLLTDQCGLHEIKEVNPILESPVSSASISNSMENILLDTDLLESVKKDWKKLVADRYSWDSVIDHYLDLYSEILPPHKNELRNLGTPQSLFSPGGDGYTVIAGDVKWIWNPEATEVDDGIRYLLPTNHKGKGRFVLDGDVTYRSFDIANSATQHSNEGVKAYWNYCIDNGLLFILPAITILITENNIFGQFGYKASRRKTIKGMGRGETTIVFRPNKKDYWGKDKRYFLYDGGDGVLPNNTSRLLNQTFKDLAIILDTSNISEGESIGVYRLSDSENQNFEFHFCRISGDGATPKNASFKINKETFFYQLVGTANTSENKNLLCEINYLTHLCHLNNPQGVDQSFIECDVWHIYSHFFVIQGGGLEIRITGGSWIWSDNPDVENQNLFYMPNTTGVGKGNLVASIHSFKPELRNKGASLVFAPQVAGSIFINFISCNLLGGGIKSKRKMVTLSIDKRVTFDKCAIPKEMEVSFTNIPNSNANGYDNNGLLLFTACGFEKDISANVQHDINSHCGRAIADELCHGLIGEQGGVLEKHAYSFDSNPFDSGRGMPTYIIKTVSMKTQHDSWPWKGSELSIILPKGARIISIKIYKPPVENKLTSFFTLNVGNADRSKDNMKNSKLYTENVHIDYENKESYYHVRIAELATKYSNSNGKKTSVLDCGCGIGKMSIQLKKMNPEFELHVSDMDPKCLKITEENVEVEKSIQVNDIADLYDKEERYDIIVLSHVLEHLYRPVESIQGLLGMLNPGGHLILAVPNSVTPLTILSNLLRWHNINRGHVVSWDRSTWRVLLEDIIKADIAEHTQDLVPIPYIWRRKLFRPLLSSLTAGMIEVFIMTTMLIIASNLVNRGLRERKIISASLAFLAIDFSFWERTTSLVSIADLIIPVVLIGIVGVTTSLKLRKVNISVIIFSIIIIVSIGSLLLLWSRRALLGIFFVMIMVLYERRYKKPSVKVFYYMIPVMFLGAIFLAFNRSSLYFDSDRVFDLSLLTSDYLQTLWLESSAFSSLMYSVESYGTQELLWGSSFLAALIFYIPRAIFPDKPYSYELSSSLGDLHYNLPASFYGEVIANFGFIGVPIMAFILGYTLKKKKIMKIVILGASGLIGHKLFQTMKNAGHETYGVLHGSKTVFPEVGFLQTDSIIESVDIIEFEKLHGILYAIRPDVVLNCVGITKRKDEVNKPLQAIGVNSLFPHQLADLAEKMGFRVIHFSTDCVFNGKMGNYNEDSDTTGEDAYGKTKALGEIRFPHTLTIRSSFIGRELAGKTELLEWLISQNGKTIRGFTQAWYSGVSTIFMAKTVLNIIENHPNISDLHQLSTPEPISKYELLCLARDSFKLDIEIIPDSSFEIKPTLDGSKLKNALNLNIPSWQDMMNELAADPLYS
ncbi:D-inositol 3-phosphate glycosyltransferase [Nymphon striatum]|nr:D-inositol 3-phosphate glycosyltransferase [Nymphon striatum]